MCAARWRSDENWNQQAQRGTMYSYALFGLHNKHPGLLTRIKASLVVSSHSFKISGTLELYGECLLLLGGRAVSPGMLAGWHGEMMIAMINASRRDVFFSSDASSRMHPHCRRPAVTGNLGKTMINASTRDVFFSSDASKTRENASHSEQMHLAGNV